MTIYPSTVSTADDKFCTGITGKSLSDQARKITVEELPQLQDGGLGTGDDPELAEDFSDQMTAYLQGQKSAAEALPTAADQWDKLLAGEN